MKLHSGFIGFIATGCLLMSPVIVGGAIQQSTPWARPVVGLIDEVQEFYPDTKLDQPVKQLTEHAARNTIAGVHIMITGLQGTEKIGFSESDGNGMPTSGVTMVPDD